MQLQESASIYFLRTNALIKKGLRPKNSNATANNSLFKNQRPD